MRKLLLFLVLGLFSYSAFGQNAYSIVRAPATIRTSFQPIVISRTLLLPKAQLPLAVRACTARRPCVLSNPQKVPVHINAATISRIHMEAHFAIPRLNRPENIYGGYNYLRTMTKLSYKSPDNIENIYQNAWQKINLTRGYNGAHHIVNKSTLEQIHQNMKAKARARGEVFTINLSEMQNNAPALFHRLHGNPEFTSVFHNKERQLQIYYTSGIKAVIDDFFEQVNLIAWESEGLIPRVPQKVMEGTYLEAELWCKMFNLRWE